MIMMGLGCMSMSGRGEVKKKKINLSTYGDVKKKNRGKKEKNVCMW
jgi:hypothetical protein